MDIPFVWFNTLLSRLLGFRDDRGTEKSYRSSSLATSDFSNLEEYRVPSVTSVWTEINWPIEVELLGPKQREDRYGTKS
jgi:hypothetical protein